MCNLCVSETVSVKTKAEKIRSAFLFAIAVVRNVFLWLLSWDFFTRSFLVKWKIKIFSLADKVLQQAKLKRPNDKLELFMDKVHIPKNDGHVLKLG